MEMTTEENKALARRFFTEVADGGHLDHAAEMMAADYRHHDPGLPPELQGSREAYINHFPMYTAAFPDMRIAVDDVVADGDKVVTRWTLTGTHNGNLWGVPPTGKRVDCSAITIQRIAGGVIVEGWTIFDALGMMQQIGVVPSPGQVLS
jgi:steroid delta-isomerase-like uncharacterized protein